MKLGAEEVVEPLLERNLARPDVASVTAAWALPEGLKARVWPLLLSKATRSKEDLLSAAARAGGAWLLSLLDSDMQYLSLLGMA